MISIDIDVLGRRGEAMIFDLARISAEPDRLVRLYLTPEHHQATLLIEKWMREAGLDVSHDAVANVRGRLPGPPDAKILMLGSHLDTVIDAGKYDGALGVISAIVAVDVVRRSGLALPFGIDVLAFGEEEGSRFPTALFTSTAVAGGFRADDLEKCDADDVSVAEALRAFGKNPEDISKIAYRPQDALAYVELHIEQGPVLEAAGAPLGIVTAIAGQSRSRVTVKGKAGHAGTVPMPLRNDALLAAAEMALFAEDLAKRGASHAMTATVGAMQVKPGAVNVIPAEAGFSLDLRAAADPPRREALETFIKEARRIAEARGCAVRVETYHDIPAAPCAPRLQDRLAEAAAALGRPAPRLSSGAGHDGQAMIKLTDIGMIFVRCRGGISHNPAEFVSIEDMGFGIAALVRFIEAAAERGHL